MKSKSAFERARDQGIAEEASAPVRTNYACKAHGCPNAGTMDGSLCYFHWRESDPLQWAAITQRIRENFDSMRNWGQFSEELQARHRADSQKRFASALSKPLGLRSGS